MEKTIKEGGLLLDKNRRVLEVEGDYYFVDVTYFVYTFDKNGDKNKLVNSFKCKCAAQDVAKYLLDKGVDCGVFKKFKEE